MPAKRVVDEDEIRQTVCLIGDPVSSIGKILYDLYITRVTAARAGYLDELDFDLDAREQDISFMAMVYIDSALGAANTTYPTGTATHPVSNIANALTIAAARNLKHLHIHGTFSITETISGYWLLGDIGPFGSPFMTLATGVATASTIFNHCMLTGTANGWAVYENDCVLLSLAGVQGLIRSSNLSGTIKVGSGITDFDKCSTVAGAITLDLDDVASGTVRFHEFIGSMSVTNLDTAGTLKIYACSGANITIAVSCDAGTVDVYGVGTVTDNSAAGCTVTDHTITADVAALNDITAANVWQTNISAYSGAGYAGTYLKTLYDDWLNGGRLDLILDTINDDTKLQFVAAGSKTIAASTEKYLSIDSGTDGAEIVSITVKGVVGADWTIETYVPVADAVAAPAAGDKRDEDVYINTDDKGGQMSNIGAIRYNMFLDITNDSAGSDNIDEVIVAYRSAGTLSLAWEA